MYRIFEVHTIPENPIDPTVMVTLLCKSQLDPASQCAAHIFTCRCNKSTHPSDHASSSPSLRFKNSSKGLRMKTRLV